MNNKAKRSVLLSLLTLLCIPPLAQGQDGTEHKHRALMFYKAQNWDRNTQQMFWFTGQGSQIIPYDWFKYLEQPESAQLFRNAKNMTRFGYIPAEPSPWNPDGMPIGFAASKNPKTDRQWIGFTCAACHTNQLNYTKRDQAGEDTHYHLLIEGAPTLANYELFFRHLIDALQATSADESKFQRFAAKLLGPKVDEAALSDLGEELVQVTEKLLARRTVNALPEGYPEPEHFAGYGRLDAFGQIQNAASAFALGDLDNRVPPTAPVSYPFLWNTHRSSVVQWNGSAPNEPRYIGPLVRNLGQVVGVYGDLEIKPSPWWKFWKWDIWGTKNDYDYRSTANMSNLVALEAAVERLHSPPWPENVFGPIDREKHGQGEELYVKHCKGCHEILDRDEQGKPYDPKIAAVGTDPLTALNAQRVVKSLALKDTREFIYFGDTFDEQARGVDLAVNGVIGLMLDHPMQVIRGGFQEMDQELADWLKGNKPTEELEVVTVDGESWAGDVAMASANLGDTWEVEGGEVEEFRSEEEKLYPASGKNKSFVESEEDKRINMLKAYFENRKKAQEHWVTESMSGAGAKNLHESEPSERIALVSTAADPEPAPKAKYKARPLNGIWATAPYLHNGSVPNLYELLTAPDQRSRKFYVGGREFDPNKVGFDTSKGPWQFKVEKAPGQIQPGNANTGHAFGTDLSEAEKMALIEYLKSL